MKQIIVKLKKIFFPIELTFNQTKENNVYNFSTPLVSSSMPGEW